MRAIRRWFFERSLKQQLRKKKNTSQARPWETLESIGLLFDAQDPDRRKWALKLAGRWKKAGKKVHLLGFIPEAEPGADFPFPHFTQKQLDWCYRPTAPEAQEFLQKKMHLLIFPEVNPSLPLHYLAALCPADLKAGYYQPEVDYLDLSIELPIGSSAELLVREIQQLLSTIKQNTPTHGAAV